MTSSLNPRFSFETFVVGAANRLAVTAGRTVAENPGSAYNPLFIYSGSGLGKTHLLMAIGHAAKTIASQLNIECLTLDEYVESFHAAIAAGQGDNFRRRFQNVDVLLVDDVQFLTNRKEMQAELLRLTEALQQSGHQIVLASDRPPTEIADLDERLISRFSGGLVVDMGVPDYETRVAILRRKAEERRATFQPGVMETVASAEFANVRELMGALNRLIAYQAVNETPINAEAAKQVLGLTTVAKGAAGAAAPATPPGGGGGDEFAQFVSDVTVTVGKAVEAWRGPGARTDPRRGGGGLPPPPPRAAPRKPGPAPGGGTDHNPLLIVGRSGLGKSPLLNAVGLELAQKKGAIVACLSTQNFIDELIAAIDGNRIDWWRARYRRATALLLDDIHLLAGKERTQEELFNLFNLLQDKDRQLVFTAPAHPNTLSGLEERIVSRLEGGLVAELKEPDRDVKRAVLERLLAQQSTHPEPALIDYLADRPTDSVRSLVGLLQRVVGAAAAQDGPLSAGLAREVLEGQAPRDTRRGSGFRASGLVVSSLGGIKSREKVVWDWVDAADRVIEDFR